MYRSCRIAWLGIFLGACALAQTVTIGPAHLTTKQYVEELDRWQKSLEAPENSPGGESPEVQEEWIIDSERGEYHVATDFLRDVETPEDRKRALEHLRDLRAGVDAGFSPASAKSPRDTASAILSRREYRSVHVPGKKESWIDQIAQAIVHAIGKLFGKAVENAVVVRNIVTVLTWGLLLGAAAFLFYWIFQTLQALTTPKIGLEGGRSGEFVSSKAAESWLEEARAAGEKGQYRLAVCLAYWGGIAGLERAGAWRPDRARTPREYLRQAANAPFISTLRLLTRDFERVWYANQVATQADLDAALLRVKELGWQ